MTTLETTLVKKNEPSSKAGQLSAAQLIAEANKAFAQGDSARVRECCAAGLERAPGNGEFPLALGHLELGEGDAETALAHYTNAARLLPEMAQAHSSRAVALLLLGHSAEAEKSANHALSVDQNDLTAYKVLARIKLDAGDQKLAEQFCRRILKANPTDPEASRILEKIMNKQPKEAVAAPSPAPAPAPAVSENLKKLESLAGDYTARTRAWRSLGPEHLMQLLSVGDYEAPINIQPKPGIPELAPDGFPVPPVNLTMGYGAGDLKHYLACGQNSAKMLRDVMTRHGVSLASGDRMLDWGGAAGRVVRNFVPEARRGVEVWGCDVHAPSIEWAKNHLSPPFKFFNSLALPQLPFPEETFKFICGFSIFTHLVVMRDAWLLELKRVLRPDGCIVLTIHNENTWTMFQKEGYPHWMPAELRNIPEMPGECIDIRGSSWEYCYTFFHSDYVRRIWGQYFKVAEIIPAAEWYQTAVVLKKA